MSLERELAKRKSQLERRARERQRQSENDYVIRHDGRPSWDWMFNQERNWSDILNAENLQAAIEELKMAALSEQKYVFKKRLYGEWEDMGWAEMKNEPLSTKAPRFKYGDKLVPKDYDTVVSTYLAMGINPSNDEQPADEIKAALQKLDIIGGQAVFEKSFNQSTSKKYDLVFRGAYPDGDRWEHAYQFDNLNVAKFWVRHVASILQPDASLEDLWFAIGFTPKKIPTKKKRNP